MERWREAERRQDMRAAMVAATMINSIRDLYAGVVALLTGQRLDVRYVTPAELLGERRERTAEEIYQDLLLWAGRQNMRAQ